ncbi:MAG: ATP-dependent helicase [Candidatus Fimenecus sp.]
MNLEKFKELRNKIIEKDFARMNAEQKKAVLTTEGPLLILAGAGSGKTTVLVNRIAYLLKYGKSYNSFESDRTPDDNDLTLMQKYLDGDKSVYTQIKDVLSYDAPKPWQILAITFTNKAANELKERLSNMLGNEAVDIWAKTFHSACLNILRYECERTGYDRNFTIYSTDDQKRVVKDVIKELSLDEKIYNYKTIQGKISSAKDKMQSPQDFRTIESLDSIHDKIADIYERYQNKLKQANAMDFDDLIFNCVKLFENDEVVRNKYQSRFKYVMIDEYQDTNMAQYRFSSLISNKYKNICVVGDDDQSIYAFRGANIENILQFEKRYKDATLIKLEENYRSTGNILNAANNVIKNNTERKGKTLRTNKGDGDKISCYYAESEDTESLFICDSINEHIKSGGNYSDCAVLYRINAMSAPIEKEFVRHGIPYRIFGGHRFFDRMEIRDIMAYISVAYNREDNVRIARIINTPKRGIGNATFEKTIQISEVLGIPLFEVFKTANQYEATKRAANKLYEFYELFKNFDEFIEKNDFLGLFDAILENSNYKSALFLEPDKMQTRIENIDELRGMIEKFTEENESGSIGDFLEEAALLSDVDNYNDGEDAVVMMTLHSAKGLEFPVVYIPGMNEGIFPSAMVDINPNELEEERRLCYVGITRAKRNLTLLSSEKRRLYGYTRFFKVSRFLDEIPNELLNKKEENVKVNSYRTFNEDKHFNKNPYIKNSFKNTNKKPTVEAALFKEGDAVKHIKFGNGIITKATKIGGDILLEISFNEYGTKKLMAKFLSNVMTKA